MAIVDALRVATASVSGSYFLLPVAGMEHPIKRERAYCYELYHQLRIALAESNLVLTGEPDKKRNPAFDGERHPNPDLILHRPGSHRHNASVVEVECDPTLRHLKKDLGNLKQMRAKGYGELVLLLFAVDTVPWQVIARAAAFNDFALSNITVLLHRRAGHAATIEHPPGGAA